MITETMEQRTWRLACKIVGTPGVSFEDAMKDPTFRQIVELVNAAYLEGVEAAWQADNPVDTSDSEL